MNQTITDPWIRWMIRRDLPRVLEIDAAWTEDAFARALKRRNCIGMVAERDGYRVVGFMVYELLPQSLNLLNLAVAPGARRRGVGTAMIETLLHKLSSHRRATLSAVARSADLGTQLFFREMGLRAVDVRPRHFGDGDDGYLFEFHTDEEGFR